MTEIQNKYIINDIEKINSESEDYSYQLNIEKLNIFLGKLLKNVKNIDIINLDLQEKLKLFEGIRIIKYSKDLGIGFLKFLLFGDSIEIDGERKSLVNIDFNDLKSFLYKLVDNEFYYETLVLESNLDTLKQICDLRINIASKSELNIYN